LSIPELAVAGFLSAVPTTLVTAPVERAKVLLQVLDLGELYVIDKFTILFFLIARSKGKEDLSGSTRE
jgi:hypothetical protein